MHLATATGQQQNHRYYLRLYGSYIEIYEWIGTASMKRYPPLAAVNQEPPAPVMTAYHPAAVTVL
jgi:hypothetical protein